LKEIKITDGTHRKSGCSALSPSYNPARESGQDTFLCDNDYQFLSGDVSDKECALLQRHERTGRPLGSERFIAQLENALSRILTPQKGGRPKKE